MVDESTRTDASQHSTVREQTTRLSIRATNCRGKLQRIADDLKRVDGVITTTMHPQSGTIDVTYDPSLTSEAEISNNTTYQGSTVARKSAPNTQRRRSSGCCCSSSGPRH